jgi:hypothetical protein
MIRPSTIFWLCMAGCVGYGLYQLKHEVQALESDLFRVNRQILAEQEAIHVLHAEWSYMTQPARLQALASRHLDLQPTKPAQLGTLATLPRLPGEAEAPLLASTPAVPVPAPAPANVTVRVTSVAAVPQRPRPFLPDIAARLVSRERTSPSKLN